MLDRSECRVAIVDYGMGNLFSVKHACDQVGLPAEITSGTEEVLAADAVILPGVGAFGDAMETLSRMGVAQAIVDFAASGKPLVGVCLGMQLLMTESHEFGLHEGLGIIEGDVVRLELSTEGARSLKVPEVGWNQINAAEGAEYGNGAGPEGSPWPGTLLQGLPDGEYMYFVHSFYARPKDPSVVLSTTRYGHIEFCSSLRVGNVFACQFHPERSGPQGLRIYRNLRTLLGASQMEGAGAREA